MFFCSTPFFIDPLSILRSHLEAAYPLCNALGLRRFKVVVQRLMRIGFRLVGGSCAQRTDRNDLPSHFAYALNTSPTHYLWPNHGR